ncbi:hypothetical protein HPB49_009380 [Dermacentor silvarum]|uniref:Uncharacterized protein n=1 Tax=Dermacentor silvarum TaxID=543639 RepID=A0ACB8CE70_DERSI|nr:hypothetical protein HPB49_009380 [Dermacentor silvarum]
MFGETSAAVITFTGKTVPFYGRYYSGEVRCKPYRPKTQVCRICHQVCHRTDVCPTAEVNLCPQCEARNPTQAHPCHPRCALCQGSHHTASKETATEAFLLQVVLLLAEPTETDPESQRTCCAEITNGELPRKTTPSHHIYTQHPPHTFLSPKKILIFNSKF